MSWSVGSIWQRWDPHLHCPGTLLEDRFQGDWKSYFERIMAAKPSPVALGITDYFTMRGYKEFVRRQKSSGLSIPLVFANVELRLSIETKYGKGINIHLLVSPEDPDHIMRMEEQLSRLGFEYLNEFYPCSDDGLSRLGRKHKKDQSLPYEVALSEGARQFKVSLGDLRRVLEDKWVSSNVLVAVASGKDGLSGLSEDSGFRAFRQELGNLADIILSANVKDIAYWSGKDGRLERDGLAVRPCLHGSDAHCVVDVLKPSRSDTGDERVCWIRGEATFEGLRQILTEPDRRVYIGPAPPRGPADAETIQRISVGPTPWFKNHEIVLNSGLVSIIGARGSGKTALAEFIAAGADALQEPLGAASFIGKAQPLLGRVAAQTTWADGEKKSTPLVDAPTSANVPRVRYLSQQFVEALCSVDEEEHAAEEPLQREIENVIFEAIPEEDRLLCGGFAELRAARIEGAVQTRSAERLNIADFTQQIALENENIRALGTIRARLQTALSNVKALESELSKIPAGAAEPAIKAHNTVMQQLTDLRSAIAIERKREQSLSDLQTEYERLLAAMSNDWERLKMKYSDHLDDDEWEKIRPVGDPNASAIIAKHKALIKIRIESLITKGTAGSSKPDGLNELEEKLKQLTAALGLDQSNARRRADLERRLIPAKRAVSAITEEETKSISAVERRKALNEKRLTAYRRVVETLDAHADSLNNLYQPLRKKLGADERLSKLSLIVARRVNAKAWAEHGERLFDLRQGPFKGVGSLASVASKLIGAWHRGTPDDVRNEMDVFAALVATQPRAHSVSPMEVGEWLFSTEHIEVRYEILYDGVSLDRLSPGTRGVVLLTLYLALDENDPRPLIIDQPEENLDPRSIYEDLVPFFRDATTRRQVIMVTHNANLVVNSDSDQIIIAKSNRITPGQLPEFSYSAGGLEEPSIREEVCRLLEGGREAFERRRQRYRRTKASEA